MPLPFVTGLREAELIIIDSIQDDFDMEQYRAAYWVYQNTPHHECPHCHANMMIAGRYDKSDRTVEGMSKPTIHDCYQCGKRVIPQSKKG